MVQKTIDYATMRRYLDALFEIQKSNPVWANEIIRTISDPLEQVHEYLSPVMSAPVDTLTFEEKRWRLLAQSKGA